MYVIRRVDTIGDDHMLLDLTRLTDAKVPPGCELHLRNVEGNGLIFELSGNLLPEKKAG